jgi:hypothetical protein
MDQARVRDVASYEAFLHIPRPVAETFAFISDFSNAPRWDPRTYSAIKESAGPIGVGTLFILNGGLIAEDWLDRLHIPRGVAGMALPYEVTLFDAPNEFVLAGESRLVRYHDHLEFAADGAGTRLRYYAELELKASARLLDQRLQALFTRIGDDATRDIPDVVGRAV